MAAKNLKDVTHNIREMSQSNDTLAIEVLKRLQDFTLQSLEKLNQLIKQGKLQEENADLQNEYEKFYNLTIDFLYKNIPDKALRRVSVSSITNVIKKTIASLEELTASVVNQTSTKEIWLTEN